jgi:hypothetical protein
MIELIFIFVSIQLITLFNIAVLNAKIELREHYKGILRSVLFRIFSSGGNSLLLNPIPFYDKFEKDKKVLELMKKRMKVCIIFWLNLIFIIAYSIFLEHKFY